MALTLRIKYFNNIVLRQDPYLATTIATACSTDNFAPGNSSTIAVTPGTLNNIDVTNSDGDQIIYSISGPGVKQGTTGTLNNNKDIITFTNNAVNNIEKGTNLVISNTSPYSAVDRLNNTWHVEESRIKGGFNEDQIDYGPRAYAVDKKYNRKHRENAMIYSGIFNSRTSVNNTNQFSIAENITKAVDLIYGSIQKLYAEDTNLIIFQENKVNGALIDKDAIFTAEGGGLTTAAKVVIGQITPYLGEFGIGKNPESFAVFGFRKYFVDRDRATVLRLSRDGLTEISSYGMNSFFRKNLPKCKTSGIRGFFDIHSRNYSLNLKLKNKVQQNKQTFQTSASATILQSSKNNVISIAKTTSEIIPGQFLLTTTQSQRKIIQDFKFKVTAVNGNQVTLSGAVNVNAGDEIIFVSPTGFGTTVNTMFTDFKTINFSDKVNGWSSFVTYNPSFAGSLNNSFFSFDGNELYKHYDPKQNKNTFYGVFQPSTITVISNQNPSLVKHYKTVNYEGTNNWKVIEMKSPAEDNLNYNAYPIPGNISGRYIDEDGVVKFTGFTPLEKKYYGHVKINDTNTITGISNLTTTGVKGFFAEATLEHHPVNNSNNLDTSKKAELFSLGFNYEQSLY